MVSRCLKSKLGLQMLTEVTRRYGVVEDTVKRLSQIFGISGACNVLGAIKTAKFYGMGKEPLWSAALTKGLNLLIGQPAHTFD